MNTHAGLILHFTYLNNSIERIQLELVDVYFDLCCAFFDGLE